jgi:hypothetical protein
MPFWLHRSKELQPPAIPGQLNLPIQAETLIPVRLAPGGVHHLAVCIGFDVCLVADRPKRQHAEWHRGVKIRTVVFAGCEVNRLRLPGRDAYELAANASIFASIPILAKFA